MPDPTSSGSQTSGTTRAVAMGETGAATPAPCEIVDGDRCSWNAIRKGTAFPLEI